MFWLSPRNRARFRANGCARSAPCPGSTGGFPGTSTRAGGRLRDPVMTGNYPVSHRFVAHALPPRSRPGCRRHDSGARPLSLPDSRVKLTRLQCGRVVAATGRPPRASSAPKTAAPHSTAPGKYRLARPRTVRQSVGGLRTTPAAIMTVILRLPHCRSGYSRITRFDNRSLVVRMTERIR